MAWIRELEYIRGFAALAVIAVHISMNFTLIPVVGLPGLLNAFIYIVAHFAVPVFIFMSGWVLALRYSGAYCSGPTTGAGPGRSSPHTSSSLPSTSSYRWRARYA